MAKFDPDIIQQHIDS